MSCSSSFDSEDEDEEMKQYAYQEKFNLVNYEKKVHE